MWRNHLGQEFALPNEDPDNLDGMVTQADYEFWISHFGDTAPGSGATSVSSLAALPAVPEPSTRLLWAAMVAGLFVYHVTPSRQAYSK